MGWGIDFPADIFLSHQDYNENIYQVEDAIQEHKESLSLLTNSILMHCSANLKDVVPEEWKDDSIEWLRGFVIDILNQIKTLNCDILKLELYKEYLTEKNKQ